MSQPLCQHCAAGVQQFKWCRNLSAGTVLQGCSCLSSVETYLLGTVLQGSSCLSGVATYLPALHCRGAAVKVVSKPICQHCVAGAQLFNRCRNLPAGTVMQGCSCLSSVTTISAGHCAAGVQLFKWCRNLSAGTVLQGCSCLSVVKTYLLGLCCRGAAV